jgi:hypothetical protein
MPRPPSTRNTAFAAVLAYIGLVFVIVAIQAAGALGQ